MGRRGYYRKAEKHWSVEVRRDGESLLVIESNFMSGKNELSEDDLEQIRSCGEHLIAFAGKRSREQANDLLRRP